MLWKLPQQEDMSRPRKSYVIEGCRLATRSLELQARTRWMLGAYSNGNVVFANLKMESSVA